MTTQSHPYKPQDVLHVPLFSEAELQSGDRENDTNKAAKRAALDYVRALDEQIAREIRSEYRAS
jgi:hypothetical protein